MDPSMLLSGVVSRWYLNPTRVLEQGFYNLFFFRLSFTRNQPLYCSFLNGCFFFLDLFWGLMLAAYTRT